MSAGCSDPGHTGVEAWAARNGPPTAQAEYVSGLAPAWLRPHIRSLPIGQSKARGPACVERVGSNAPIASLSPSSGCDPDHTVEE